MPTPAVERQRRSRKRKAAKNPDAIVVVKLTRRMYNDILLLDGITGTPYAQALREGAGHRAKASKAKPPVTLDDVFPPDW